jgi:hypothetical protein
VSLTNSSYSSLYYALTKNDAECVGVVYLNLLTNRTSFSAGEWAHHYATRYYAYSVTNGLPGIQYVNNAIAGATNAALMKSGGTMSGVLSMGGYRITNLAAPTDATDAATKGYVDGCTNAVATPSLVASGARSPRDYAWYLNAMPSYINDSSGVGFGGLAYEYNGQSSAHAMWLLGDVKNATGMVVKIHTAVAQGSNCISGIFGFMYQQTTGEWYSLSAAQSAQYTTNGATYTRKATTYSYIFPVVANAIVHVKFNAHGLGVNAGGQQTTGVVHGITWSAYK